MGEGRKFSRELGCRGLLYNRSLQLASKHSLAAQNDYNSFIRGGRLAASPYLVS
jgi:hypothetical protein